MKSQISLDFVHTSPALLEPCQKLTMLGSRLEVHHIVLFGHEQPIVRSIPVLVLRIGVGIIRQSSESLVPSNRGQVSSDWVNNVVDSLMRAEFVRGEKGNV